MSTRAVARWLRAATAAPFRLLPGRLRREIVRSALVAETWGDPARALRGLLRLDSDLSGLIDETGMRYEHGIHPKHRVTGYHDFFVARVKPGERVLDIGCGDGAVAHAVATRAGADVVGIDLDAAKIARASRRFDDPRLTFVAGDVTANVPAGAFNVVIASNVIEHLARRIEFYRTVQERGRPTRWLVRVPMIDRDWQVPLRRELGLPYFSDPTHHTEYTRETFEAEANEAGLRVVHLQVNWGEIWAELVPTRSGP